MVAPTAILAQPDDHRGVLAMSEAVDAMLEAFRNWAKDPLVGELRRRTHTPKNVRTTLHQGGAPAYGTTGIMTHAELVRIFGDRQRYPRRGRPVLVLYDSDTAALKLILIGEMHPKELPNANSVVAMPTAWPQWSALTSSLEKTVRSRAFLAPEIRPSIISWR